MDQIPLKTRITARAPVDLEALGSLTPNSAPMVANAAPQGASAAPNFPMKANAKFGSVRSKTSTRYGA